MKNHLHLQAKIDQLPFVLKWIREHLQKSNFQKAEINRIELAIEEAIVNIMNYAYPNKKGEIDIFFYLLSGKAILEIHDSGVPFNPVEKVSTLTTYIPVKERKIGGLGIPLIFQLMDSVEYERREEQNVLILQKKCG